MLYSNIPSKYARTGYRVWEHRPPHMTPKLNKIASSHLMSAYIFRSFAIISSKTGRRYVSLSSVNTADKQFIQNTH